MSKPKGKHKKHVPATKPQDPVFLYTSVCCKVQAKKPACKRKPEDKAENKFSESPLGSWRCSQCEQPCKVTRSKFKREEPNGAVTGDTGTEAGTQA